MKLPLAGADDDGSDPRSLPARIFDQRKFVISDVTRCEVMVAHEGKEQIGTANSLADFLLPTSPKRKVLVKPDFDAPCRFELAQLLDDR